MATRTASGDALSRDWTVASALELCVWRGKGYPSPAQLACARKRTKHTNKTIHCHRVGRY